MTIRLVVSVVVIFVVWAILDFVIHGVILGSTYAQQPELWRPMDEIHFGLTYSVTVVCTVAFASIYGFLVSPKSLGAGLTYGLLFGIAFGYSMGFGTFSVMPVPARMAVIWFLGTIVEFTLAGGIVGAIVNPAARDAEHNGLRIPEVRNSTGSTGL